MQEKELIKSCLKGEAEGYNALYEQYAPKMLGVCARYAKDLDDAKDLLQDGFIKVFEGLNKFRFEGSLEGWIRRIMINEALNYYKRQGQLKFQNTELSQLNIEIKDDTTDIISELSHQELLDLIQALSPKYRLVFNLYVIEGYKHHEIATLLGIGEGTSKSNLQDARRSLQQKIYNLNNTKNIISK